jgi:hypothetical protein
MESANMRRIKLISALAAFAVASLFAVALHAYPAPGPGQETYVTYYSDASRTTVVGVRTISRSNTCTIYHVSWGNTSSYSRVTVGNCESPS